MGVEKNSKPVEGHGVMRKQGASSDLSHRSFTKLVSLQLLCASTIFAGIWIVPGLVGVNLIQQPVETLQITLAMALPVSLIAFSVVQLNCKADWVPAWWAILRGLMGFPVGVCGAAFVAIVLGAPLPLEVVSFVVFHLPRHATKTLCWASLMSTLVVVPGATVLGTSWPSWLRIFACSEPVGPVEIAICIPAHGAALGAWFGAIPMPLDWERPWQEWPVCCTYGAVGGYLLSLFGSLLWTQFNVRSTHKKEE